MRKRRKLQRDQFIFDHLWGVPGGLQPEDLILLRSAKNSCSAIYLQYYLFRGWSGRQGKMKKKICRSWGKCDGIEMKVPF